MEEIAVNKVIEGLEESRLELEEAQSEIKSYKTQLFDMTQKYQAEKQLNAQQ